MRGREQWSGGIEALGSGGAIGGGAPYRLYFLAAASNASGRLILEDPSSIQWEIFFKRGIPHFVRSSSQNLGLGRYLLAQRILGEDQINRAQAAMREGGGELVEVLARCGDLEFSEVFRILVGYSRALLVRALAADGGSYRWEEGLAAPEGSQPLGDRWELLCEAGRRLRSDLILGRLGPWANAPVARVEGELVSLQDIGLNAQELRLAAALDGSRSLAELAAAAPHETERIYRTGYLLLQVGLLRFTREPSGGHAELDGARQAAIPFDPAFTPAPAQAIRASSIADLLNEALAETEEEAPIAPAAGAGPRSAGPSAAAGTDPRSAGPSEAGAGAGPRSAGPSAAGAGAGPRPAGSSAAGAEAGPRPAGPGAAAAGPGPRSAGPSAAGAGVSRGPGQQQSKTGGKGGQRAAAPERSLGPRPPQQRSAAEAASPEVVAFLEALEGQDHFEVLGVERTAGTAEVKKAYFRLARLHHPDTAAPKDRRAKERITSRLNEAYGVLGDEASRAAYLSALEITGGPESVDIGNLLEAEKLFRQATLLIKARRFKEAVSELDEAIELNDSEGEFYAWRAFARFSSTPDKRKVEKETFDELRLAMEKSPKASVPHLLAGRVSTVLGDLRAAIRYYQRCLALEPGSIEAQRELRLLESRMQK